MNNVYFACKQCKIYVDAGYRWAYSHLEKPGLVRQGEVVHIDGLLSANSYWQPQTNDQNEWLISTLHCAREFLRNHQSHPVLFCDEEHVMGVDTSEYEQFAWMNGNPDDTDLKPRNFVEQLGMRNWGEVTAYIASRPHKPWWYEVPTVRIIARRKFEELLLSKSALPPIGS